MLVLLALLSCQPAGIAGLSQDDPPDDWWVQVQRRSASDVRAIHPRGKAFVANLPLLGSEARFNAQGVALGPRGLQDQGLGIQFQGWGRDLSRPVDRVQPRLGACTTERDLADRCVQRLEYAHSDVTEWWVGLDNGLEQGWTLYERPPGQAQLVIDVALEGVRTLRPVTDGLQVVDHSGASWSIGGLVAWDADGVVLASQLLATEAGFQIRVDDRGARWPLTVDPVYESAATTFLGGVGRLGSALAGVGDVNGDGYDDVLLSAPAQGYDTGKVSLHLGGAGGLSRTATTILQGEETASSFGTSVSAAGDLNGDGYADVAVGAPAEDDHTGAVRFYLGGPSGLATEAHLVLRGDTTEQEFGASIAGGADINGDGFPDFVAGAPRAGDDMGRISVYLGSATGLAETPVSVVTGSDEAGAFGSSVALLGDIDGDGFGDVAVGAPQVDSLRGSVSVFPGSPAGLAETSVLVIGGDGSLEGFGHSVAAAGDVNGDGLFDLAVGAPYSAENGLVYVHHGGEDGLRADPSSTLALTDVYLFGWQVRGAGDVNGDGYDDLIVGSPDDVSSRGSASLFLGGDLGLGTTPTLSVEGMVSSEAGYAVDGAGDINGDGLDDILVGTPGHEDDQGQVDLYQGRPLGPSDVASRTISGDEQSVFFGQTLAGAGDLNGDGFDEVVIGAWWSERVYLYTGSVSGLSSTPFLILSGPEDQVSSFGRSLVGAGDLDGDGFDDLVIGAPSFDSGRGAVFSYLGGATGIDPAIRAQLDGPEEDGAFGFSLDAAGDTNADGFDDLVIGAYLFESRTGRAYIAQGSTAGLSSRELSTISAPDADGSFGYAVAGLGDVDGDGADDVLIGAPRHDSSTGRAYLFQGSAIGMTTTPSLTLSGRAAGGLFGASLAGAGDVNGDGFADAAVGASDLDDEAGEVYLYLGAAAGLSGEAFQTLKGVEGSRFGVRLAAGGDFDLDGFADLAIGASEQDVSGLGGSTGAVYLHEGSEDGLSSEPTVQLFGSRVNQSLGSALALAGDINGDGYSDLLVGSQALMARLYLGYADDDGDGHLSVDDCDDSDPEVGEPTESFYLDADGDGFGDPETYTIRCETEGTTDSADCDDSDPSIHPSAEEIPGDGIDQDCDGEDADPGTDGGGSDGGGSDGGSDGGGSDGGGSDGGGLDPDDDGDKGRCSGCAATTLSSRGLASLMALFVLLAFRRRP